MRRFWDATKHQDDKIGQLLTSIAFLTAATLALAALESASFVTRTFDVGPINLPLGLITLTVFLIGVVFSVMMLLTSLSTPLRLPGIGTSRKKSNIHWVRGVRASQIYFFEMAGVSLDEWEYKWGESAEELKAERLDSLVRETHNLGLRTSAKYDRTTEAVALLSVSLLGFALSIIFVAIVASSPRGEKPIALELWQRCVIAGTFACYCWLQLIARIRYDRQAVDETPQRGTRSIDRRRFLGELSYATLLAILVADILVFERFERSWPGSVVWAIVTVALALASVAAFWCATWQVKVSLGPKPSTENSDSRQRSASYRRRWTLTGLTIVFTASAIFGGLKGWYVFQLGAASFAVLSLIVSSVLQPTLRLNAARRAYRNRSQPPGGGQSAPTPNTTTLGPADNTVTNPSS